MGNEHKTNKQLINELVELRKRIAELEASEAEGKRTKDVLQRQLEKLEIIFDSVPVMIFYKDKANRFIRVNKTFTEVAGMPKEKIEGKTAFEVYPDKAEGHWRDDKEVIVYGHPKKNIIEPLETAKGTRWVQIDKIPDRDKEGNIIGTINFATDITGWVRAEEDLKEYSEGLEERVEQRTKELKAAQEQLLRREKLAILGQLAGGVGHELRNPLGVMSNAVYYLKTILHEVDATTEEYLGIISSEIHNANKIISDLLGFSRIRPAEWKEIAVSDLVAQVLEKQLIPENVEVITRLSPGLPALFVDHKQIGQVLVNLVTNACQAMPEGGKLTIGAQTEKSHVSLSITDTGCGMSEEDMKKSFEPLFTTKARGIGLGLAVSKNLVETNGGSIEMESDEGKGSTFRVILPIKKAVS